MLNGRKRDLASILMNLSGLPSLALGLLLGLIMVPC
jgi:hypothetical protein